MYMARKKLPREPRRPPAKQPEYPVTKMRNWRDYRAMTLEAVGEALEDAGVDVGTSHAQIGRIERGEQPYNQPLLEGLAKLYDTDVPSLLDVDPFLDPPERRAAKKRVLKLVDRLDPDQITDVEKFAEFIGAKKSG
jgi:transcriptional regulator with XRE-family HTH domain